MRRGNGGVPLVRRIGPPSDLRWVVAGTARRHYDGGRLGRRIGRRGHTTRAPTQGPRPKGGRHDVASFFPFGIGTKATNRSLVILRSLPYLTTPVSPFHGEPLQSHHW